MKNFWKATGSRIGAKFWKANPLISTLNGEVMPGGITFLHVSNIQHGGFIQEEEDEASEQKTINGKVSQAAFIQKVYQPFNAYN